MKLKHVVGAVVTSACFYLGVSSERADAYVYPVSYGHYYAGYYAGWGWYPIVSGLWPWVYYGYPAVVPYGYSYYPAYGYLPRYSTFGAIAYSPETSRVGYAWGKLTRSDAASAAESFCGPADCREVVWVQGGCAAIAKGVDMTQVSWGYHSSKHGAYRHAMRACRSAGGLECRIGAWVCSF